MYVQARAALEKSKSTLEAEAADLATEVRSAGATRAELERRRKQAEAAQSEALARLTEVSIGTLWNNYYNESLISIMNYYNPLILYLNLVNLLVEFPFNDPVQCLNGNELSVAK